MDETPKTTAEESKAALATSPLSSPSPVSTSTATTEAASESKAFYLTDFKTGYSDGYNAGLNGQASSVSNTTREGYNDGFKEGYGAGYQALAKQQTTSAGSAVATGNRASAAQQSIVYRPSGAPAKRRGSSKLKTALTI